jgi:PilZ domain
MSEASSAEKRVRARVPVCLRVDARLIDEQERDAILAGLGFSELNNEGMALSRPRHGLRRSESRDVSASGLRLKVDGLNGVESGRSLCLDIHLPEDRRVVKLLGDVMWVGERNGEPVAGLRMAALQQEGLRRLLAALE